MPYPVETYSPNEMATALGKSVPFVRHLQSGLSLYVVPRGGRYPESYLHFMRRIISLRTFNVPLDDIGDLLRREIRIQELLHLDSLSSNDPLWYLGPGGNPAHSPSHLLLTGRDLGFRLRDQVIQVNLDFHKREDELFGSHEMGEDVRRVLDLYLKLVERMDERIRTERPVLRDALAWAGPGLLPSRNGNGNGGQGGAAG